MSEPSVSPFCRLNVNLVGSFETHPAIYILEPSVTPPAILIADGIV